MKITWSTKAISDVDRLRRFIALKNPIAARKVSSALYQAVKPLSRHPRLGMQLENFPEREVRRLISGKYEIRYEIEEHEVIIVSVFHGREDR